jgi:hypothetical protein
VLLKYWPIASCKLDQKIWCREVESVIDEGVGGAGSHRYLQGCRSSRIELMKGWIEQIPPGSRKVQDIIDEGLDYTNTFRVVERNGSAYAVSTEDGLLGAPAL